MNHIYLNIFLVNNEYIGLCVLNFTINRDILQIISNNIYNCLKTNNLFTHPLHIFYIDTIQNQIYLDNYNFNNTSNYLTQQDNKFIIEYLYNLCNSIILQTNTSICIDIIYNILDDFYDKNFNFKLFQNIIYNKSNIELIKNLLKYNE